MVVLQKEVHKKRSLVEGIFCQWLAYLHRQKKARQSLEHLASLARADARRRAAWEGLGTKLTAAEILLSQRQARVQNRRLTLQIWAAWARHTQHAAIHSEQAAMTAMTAMTTLERVDDQDLKPKESELQDLAEMLRERSHSLHRDALPLQACLGSTELKGRAILRHCWQQWQAWRREHLRYVTHRQEEAIKPVMVSSFHVDPDP